MKLQRISQISLPASDLDRAVAFYRALPGVEFLASFNPPGLAFFEVGGTRLMLSLEAREASALYLAVDGIDEAVDHLRHGGIAFDGEPHRIFVDEAGQFGQPGVEEWMAFFRDSEGNVLALHERRSPS